MSALIPPEAERRTFGSLTRADLGADAWYDEPGTDIVSGRICRISLEWSSKWDVYVSLRFEGSLGGLPAMDPSDSLWILQHDRPNFAPPSILDRVPFNDAVKVA